MYSSKSIEKEISSLALNLQRLTTCSSRDAKKREIILEQFSRSLEDAYRKHKTSDEIIRRLSTQKLFNE